MYFPTHPAGTTYSRLVSRSTSPDTPTISNPKYGSLSRFKGGKVCLGSLCEKCVWRLINRKATGSGYFTRHFIHHFRRLDRLQTLILAEYLGVPMVSRLYGNGFHTPVMIPRMSPRNRWAASGSWSHACWPSTSIEKKPSLMFLVRQCTGRRSGRNPHFARRGFWSYGISSSF